MLVICIHLSEHILEVMPLLEQTLILVRNHTISHDVGITFAVSEGLAVGVGFGAVGKTPSATFENAR